MTDTSQDRLAEVLEARRRFPVGSVVRNRIDGDRGIVRDFIEPGRTGTIWPAACVGDMCIQFSPGHHRITNCYDNWGIVPYEDRTVQERVQSILWSHEGDPSDDDGYSSWDETLAGKLLVELVDMSEVEHETVFSDYDWPCSIDEIAIALARVVDARNLQRAKVKELWDLVVQLNEPLGGTNAG